MRYLVIILICSSFVGFSQEKKTSNDSVLFVQMTGIVITDSLYRVPFTRIYDRTTKKGVIADYYGYFALVVHPGDTLEFSCIGFKKKRFIVSDTMTLETFSLVQVLKYDTIVADPVEVYPWPSKEQFAEYFVNMDSPFDQIRLAQQRLTPQELAFVGTLLSGDATSAYSASQQQFLQQQYIRGMGPANNLLNPAAWNEFMQGIGTGKYQISP